MMRNHFGGVLVVLLVDYGRRGSKLTEAPLDTIEIPLKYVNAAPALAKALTSGLETGWNGMGKLKYTDINIPVPAPAPTPLKYAAVGLQSQQRLGAKKSIDK